jgi:predicted O-methyltransferase YrrM
MTLAAILNKASRLPTVARDGLRYPALRLQASTAEPAVGVLAGLGFDRDELRGFEREFEELAPAVYAQLADAGRAAGDDEAASRAAHPSESSAEGKKLMYLAVRALGPSVAVETGPFNGAGTTFLLHALEQSGDGRLLSFDLGDARDALGVPLPAGKEPAWMVPDELRPRLELVLGDTRRTLRRRLAVEREIDLFVHDSLHTTRHMLFEFRAAWRGLRPGGVLISDDVFWNPAFWLFTKRHRVPFRHIGTMGATRKRG